MFIYFQSLEQILISQIHCVCVGVCVFSSHLSLFPFIAPSHCLSFVHTLALCSFLSLLLSVSRSSSPFSSFLYTVKTSVGN